MADDPVLTDRVRRGLADQPDVEEKRMFGSVGFLVDGSLRIAVGTHPDHVAMVRIGSADPETVAGPGVRPVVMRGRPVAGWVFLEREAIVSDEDVARWISVGLAAVRPARRIR